jgi:hypothetical protein
LLDFCLEEKMNNSQFPKARRNGLVVQDVTDEVLVYDLDTNKAHCLNQSAAIVWKSCDGTRSVAEIARLVESETGGSVNDDFVWLAIDQLNDSSLMESAVRSSFAGESRREVIKKIGLATMIGLPVIASLVAPQSALASNSCACVTPGDCTTQTGCTSTVNCNGSGVCAP